MWRMNPSGSAVYEDKSLRNAFVFFPGAPNVVRARGTNFIFRAFAGSAYLRSLMPSCN